MRTTSSRLATLLLGVATLGACEQKAPQTASLPKYVNGKVLSIIYYADRDTGRDHVGFYLTDDDPKKGRHRYELSSNETFQDLTKKIYFYDQVQVDMSGARVEEETWFIPSLDSIYVFPEDGQN